METYVAAYKYGSVVIFNGREREQEVLKLCQEFCTEPTKQNYTEGKYTPENTDQLSCSSYVQFCKAANSEHTPAGMLP